MHNKDKAIKQYLQHYAEPEAQAVLKEFIWPGTYQHCILIPAFKESADLIDRLVHIAEYSPCLLYTSDAADE